MHRIAGACIVRLLSLIYCAHMPPLQSPVPPYVPVQPTPPPAEPPAPLPRKSHTSLIVISTVMVAILGIIIGGWVYFYGPVPEAPLLPAAVSSSTPAGAVGIGTTTPLVLVSKSIAGKDYAGAVNAAIADLRSAGFAVTELTSLLQQLNTRSAAGSYSGILTLIDKARAAQADAASTTAHFSDSLTALGAAEVSVTDPAVLEATTAFIQAGRPYVAALNAYFDAITPVLRWKTPSQNEIAMIVSTSRAVETTGTATLEPTATLVQLLNDSILSLVKDAPATTTGSK